MYLIVSDYHNGAYWRPNGNGYTRDVSEAGLYDEEAARRCVARSPDRNRAVDAMPLLRDAREMAAADVAILDALIAKAAE